MSHVLLVNVFTYLISTAYGGWPITQPNTTNGRSDNQGPTWNWEGGEKIPVPYNMVDVYPSCNWRGICPMFPPGGELSAFPNSEEKWQHLIHNMFRMFGNQSLDIKWGKWQLAVNKNLGRTYYCPNCKYCGLTHRDKVPLYWYSDANQAARFKQYDENACDQDWYDEPGINAHNTCDWVLDEYGGGSHCDLFGEDCGFGARGSAFSPEDDAWFETEGICGANTCYRDAHCEPIFANKYDYQGTGFVAGMNGASGVYARFTDEINYTLHSGAHIDQRMRLVGEDRNKEDGKFFTLAAMYFDVEKQDNLDRCWSLYNGTYHVMGAEVSWDITNGTFLMDGITGGTTFGTDSYNVMVASYHKPPVNTCEPYAFLCKSQAGKYFRLPQDPSYFFGTEWMDWAWSDYAGNWNLSCKENHYYYNEYEDNGKGLWVANSGYSKMNPTANDVLNRSDIWYYQQGNKCIGCSKIAALQCVERCLQFDECDNCEFAAQTEPPTGEPTSSPTNKPTMFPDPTPDPTLSPINGSYIPPNEESEVGDTTSNGGVIAAVILIIILVCGGIGLWVWWRIKQGAPILPRSASIRAKNDESQISKHSSDHNKLQVHHVMAPSTSMGYDPPQQALPPPVPTDAIPNIGDDDDDSVNDGDGDNATGDYDLDI